MWARGVTCDVGEEWIQDFGGEGSVILNWILKTLNRRA